MLEKDEELLVASAPTIVELLGPVPNVGGDDDVEAYHQGSVMVVAGSSYTVTVGLVSLHDHDAVVVMTGTTVPFVVESDASVVEVAATVSLPRLVVDNEGVTAVVATETMVPFVVKKEA